MQRATCLGSCISTNGTQTVYTAPAGKFAIVKAIVFLNYSGATRSIYIHFPVPGTDDFAGLEWLLPSAPANDAPCTANPYIVVNSGKSLKVEGNGTNVAVSFFGVELPT